MSWGSMGAAGGGADMLQQILREKFSQSLRLRQQKSNEADRAEARRIQQQQLAINEENQKYLREQRTASADLHKQQAADRVASQLMPGSVLDADATGALRDGRLGSLIEHQQSQLPSTAFAGAVQQTQRAPRILNLARTMNEGHEERDVFRGTAKQQQAAQERTRLMAIANDPNTSASVRQYIQLTDAMPGNGSLPATLFQSDEQPVYQVGPDGTPRKTGTVPRGARVVNAPPVRIRGARVVGADDPTLPRGSQAYALEIAAKHGGDWDAALAEATAYINDPQTRRDHPTLSPQKFLGAVKAGVGRPTGARRPGAGGSNAAPVFSRSGAGAVVRPPAAAASTSGKIGRAHV